MMITSNNQGIDDYKWAVKEIHFGMKFCGVYFNNDLPKWQQLLITLRAIFTVCTVFNFIVIPSVPALIKVWGDVTLIIDNLVVTIPYTLSICHFMTMWHNKDEIIMLFSEIKNDWIAKKSDAERDIMIRNTKIAMTITRFAYSLVITVVILHCLPFWTLGIVPRSHTNITDGDQPLIAQTVYFWDMTDERNFKITAIGQTMCSMIVGISYSTAGCIFYTFILHVSGQLHILKIHLEQLFDDGQARSNLAANKSSKVIGSVVRRHQKLIRFVEAVEHVFNFMFLQNFICTTIILSTEGFLVISVLVGDVEAPVAARVFTIFYILYSGVMTLIYSTSGEFLIQNSAQLYSAAYNSLWYNSDHKYRMDLAMIIIRAQKPLYISVGKFVPISLSTYASLVKTSASYLSVLLAMKA